MESTTNPVKQYRLKTGVTLWQRYVPIIIMTLETNPENGEWTAFLASDVNKFEKSTYSEEEAIGKLIKTYCMEK
jgi:hypothetical protein